MHRPGVELAISRSQVPTPYHYTTEAPILATILAMPICGDRCPKEINSNKFKQSKTHLQCLWIHPKVADALLTTFAITEVNVELSPSLCHGVGAGGCYMANESCYQPCREGGIVFSSICLSVCLSTQ